MGLILSASAACFLFSLRIPALSSMVFPALCVTLLYIYVRMRRLSTTERGYQRIAPLWLYGIYTYLFGALIAALFSAVVLIFVEPGFLTRYLSTSVAQIEASEMAADMAEHTALMRRALDAGIVPSESQFVSAMGWLTALTGSLVSLVIAALLVKTRRGPSPRREYN